MLQAKADNMQKNNNCRLHNIDETVNHISKCIKLVQKGYKSRHAWVGKVIYWKLCKKLKLIYMHKPQNKIHKILWDSEIQMNYQIPTRRPNLVLIDKKRIYLLVYFVFPVYYRVKIKENKNIDKYLDYAREQKKL